VLGARHGFAKKTRERVAEIRGAGGRPACAAP